MVKHHGENSQSAQAIELGQIGSSFMSDFSWSFFFGGHHLRQTQQRRLSVVRATARFIPTHPWLDRSNPG
jgi:hypothetical protein